MFQALRSRWRRWVNLRIPRADKQVLSQRNIFILPTGAGVVFGILLLVMLITGINYQNSLIYLLTFLLGAILVAAMHQTHRNLAGLELTLVQAGEGFAGDRIPFRFRAVSGKHDAVAISLSCDDCTLSQQHVPAGQTGDLVLSVASVERGYFRPDRVRVETRFPFGLLKAWSWVRPVSFGIAYPRPVAAPDATSTVSDGEDQETSRSVEGNDHADMRPWREGDLAQRVLWKRYARTGQMVIADWEGEQGSPHWIDYQAFPGVDQELRISYLTALVLDRSRSGTPFGLNLPGQVIDPDAGPAHVSRCLKSLAVFGLEKPRDDSQSAFGTRSRATGSTVVGEGVRW
ncbi:DUF58 domain-containing protein [uncultured Marinobacter sp.]|uniref:DUF58 domain-containing protein n=1 Tax=uncultured Marinobacter sp. TaxID=187379 RepID=UPI00262D6910|nr:DUF58 domain-containing protein [uncultured Marinobacter sp.]